MKKETIIKICAVVSILFLIGAWYSAGYKDGYEKGVTKGEAVGYKQGISDGFDQTIETCGMGYHALLKNKCPDIYKEMIKNTKKIYPNAEELF